MSEWDDYLCKHGIKPLPRQYQEKQDMKIIKWIIGLIVVAVIAFVAVLFYSMITGGFGHV